MVDKRNKKSKEQEKKRRDQISEDENEWDIETRFYWLWDKILFAVYT